jgi:hypothetical protein
MKPTKTVNIITGEIRYSTNYDKIIHMGVEELAEWIYTHRWNDFDGLLDWLKKGIINDE